MALGTAVLFAIDGLRTPGGNERKMRFVELTGDASYPAGGYAITAAMFGLTTIEYAQFNPTFTTTVAALRLPVSWDKGNSKVMISTSGTADAGLNEAGAADVTATTVIQGFVIGV